MRPRQFQSLWWVPGPIRGVRSGVDSSFLGASRTDDFDRVFAVMIKEHPDALYVSSGPLMTAIQERIAGLALKNRLPSVYDNRAAVDDGGLMSYGADVSDSYRLVGWYVDK